MSNRRRPRRQRPDAARTLTARSTEDLVALVPIMLTFAPTDSVAMLTFGGRRGFHGRADLPDGPHDVAGLARASRSLLAPAARHGVRAVFLGIYTADADLAAAVGRRLVADFRAAGMDVVDAVRVHGDRYFAVVDHDPSIPAEGVPCAAGMHRFAAEAVYAGQVVHASRAALAATLEPDPARVAPVEAALGRLPEQAPASERRWVCELVDRSVSAGLAPDDAEVARLLRACRHLAVRDAVWWRMDRGSAPAWLAFWSDVLRRTPASEVPAVAALTGFSAWLAGNGALAWCAVDRCLAADPDYTMAALLAGILNDAVAPAAWDERGRLDSA